MPPVHGLRRRDPGVRGRPGCAPHATGTDGEDGGKTIQLFPYNDTPRNGGVYKVWVTPTSTSTDGNGAKFCFVPRFSKTDNFKVRDNRVVEIDVQFWRDGVSTPLLGMVATWIDTNVPVSVKSHSAGDASYFVDVLCAS